jgi:hypothetical protein
VLCVHCKFVIICDLTKNWLPPLRAGHCGPEAAYLTPLDPPDNVPPSPTHWPGASRGLRLSQRSPWHPRRARRPRVCMYRPGLRRASLVGTGAACLTGPGAAPPVGPGLPEPTPPRANDTAPSSPTLVGQAHGQCGPGPPAGPQIRSRAPPCSLRSHWHGWLGI